MKDPRAPLSQFLKSGRNVKLRNISVVKGLGKAHTKPSLLSSRTHMALTSNRLFSREKQLSPMPSNLRVFLQQSTRSVIFLTALIVLYYFLFVNHQKLLTKFRRMKKIHDELEAVLRNANDGLFVNPNLISAVLSNTTAPALFNQIDSYSSNSTVEISGENLSTSLHLRSLPQLTNLTNQKATKSAPLLHANPESKLNESASEQFFSLGHKQEHLAMYKPLCLDTHSEDGISFEGEAACESFNRRLAGRAHHCPVMKSRAQKEMLLRVLDRKSKEWLDQNSESIEWVAGLTVLQILDRSCGNIAHFSGRVLFLQHLIENAGSYAAPHIDITNILIMPDYHVMKRFSHPEKYFHWHETLLRALISPAHLDTGDLGSFLYKSTTVTKPNQQIVHLVHNLSLIHSAFAQKRYVCFKRALVPGFLKGRFFVSDAEYPSTKPSFQFSTEGSPIIPRDSLRLREKVSTLLGQKPWFGAMKKEIILIDRKGTRRIFDESRKSDILEAFNQVAKKHGYNFKVISFENMSFNEQYKAVSSASIAIGIHGANLVNTMFMPPLSVLIEIFPFGFTHGMYRNGGNAGLKYYSYKMKTGIKFEGGNVYGSPEECVRINHACKVHYRDSVLQVRDEDISNMSEILEEAVGWYEKDARENRRRLSQHLSHAA